MLRNKTPRTKRTRFLAACFFGIVAGLLVGWQVSWGLALLTTWDVTALIFTLSIWYDLHACDGDDTEKVARRDDMGRTGSDTIVTLAAVMSIVAVIVLITTKAGGATTPNMHIAFGLASVVISWATVHMLYALRYAYLFYEGHKGGVDFAGVTKPTFGDFMYLAFTIGMTYQVSDTTFTSSQFRNAALKHALLSFIFGTTIIATSINLVVNLTQ